MSKHVESVGPFAGTTKVDTVCQLGKRKGTITEVPVSYIRADTQEGLNALIAKNGLADVLDRYNYGSLLKERATKATGKSGKKRADRVYDWLSDKALDEAESGSEDRTYRDFRQEVKALSADDREQWLNDFGDAENVV